jgi:hypothetical protein
MAGVLLRPRQRRHREHARVLGLTPVVGLPLQPAQLQLARHPTQSVGTDSDGLGALWVRRGFKRAPRWPSQPAIWVASVCGLRSAPWPQHPVRVAHARHGGRLQTAAQRRDSCAFSFFFRRGARCYSTARPDPGPLTPTVSVHCDLTLRYTLRETRHTARGAR